MSITTLKQHSDLIYLDPPPIYMHTLFKGVVSFSPKIAVQILYHHFYYQYISLFPLYKETYPSITQNCYMNRNISFFLKTDNIILNWVPPSLLLTYHT